MKKVIMIETSRYYIELPDYIDSNDTDAVEDYLELNDAWPNERNLWSRGFRFEEAPE